VNRWNRVQSDEAARAIGNRIIEICLDGKVSAAHQIGMSFYGIKIEELIE